MAGKLDDLKDALTKALKQIASPANMRKYGETAAGMIKLRTRLGYGVSEDAADKEPLRSLSDTTIERRKELQKKGMLSDLTSPRRSNLTQSGQLLDSIQVTSVDQGEVRVGPKGNRTDGLNNEDLAGYVSDQGRPFNHLSRIESKRMIDAVRKDLRDALARLTTNRK